MLVGVLDVDDGVLVGGGAELSGSVYWLSPADGPESANATAGAWMAALAASVVTTAVAPRLRRI